MKILLSDHFTAKKILQYALPNIGAMLALTTFSMTDGFFVSNALGVLPFAAVNIVLPMVMILSSAGIMFSSGGSAYIAKLKGEQKNGEAIECFSLVNVAVIALGVLMGVLFYFLLPLLLKLLGTAAETIPYCLEYGRTIAFFFPAMLLCLSYMGLWVTVEKARTGFVLSIIQGLVNIVLDWLLMMLLKRGVGSAAFATGFSMLVYSVYTLFYFRKPNDSGMHFARFCFNLRGFGKICYNGMSEMINSASDNIMELLFNFQLLVYLGEIGVAAFGVCSYLTQMQVAAFFAIGQTVVAVVGYKYGAKDYDDLKSFVRQSTLLNIVLGIFMTAMGILFAQQIAGIFVGYDPETLELATKAIRIGSLSFLLQGVNIVSASTFTGLGEGTLSVVVSLFHSLIGPAVFVFLLPWVFGADGIWAAQPAGALLTAVVAILLLLRYNKSKMAVLKEKRNL